MLNSFLLHQLNATNYAPYVSGTTRLKLPQGPMRQIPLVVPALAKQTELVAYLDEQLPRLDASVAALLRAQANLKRYRASVLKAACEGRLVPTEAELARIQGRDFESGAQLLQRILPERRAQWAGKGKYLEPVPHESEGLSELPDGWVWASLDQLSWDSGYGTSAKCSYEATGLPVLRIPNVQAGQVDTTDLKFSTAHIALKDGAALKAGDMLVIRTNGSKSLIG